MILPPEKQVCALEYSKRLKELGCPQESIWYWVTWENEATGLYAKEDMDNERGHYLYKSDCSAYTVAELGESLPENRVRTTKWMGSWYCELYKSSPLATDGETRKAADTEASARAKIKIYLLENK